MQQGGIKTNKFDLAEGGGQTFKIQYLALEVWAFSPKFQRPNPKFRGHGRLGPC